MLTMKGGSLKYTVGATINSQLHKDVKEYQLHTKVSTLQNSLIVLKKHDLFGPSVIEYVHHRKEPSGV